MDQNLKFAVVIPAKNEEDYLGLTLGSLANQSLKPEICVVVDDFSDDATPKIIQEYASKAPFIHYLRNSGTAAYTVGGHVVKMFYKGKEYIDNLGISYDYMVKMDADLSFENGFFEAMHHKIRQDYGYGIVSGTPFYYEKSRKIFEISPLWHSHGQFKFYNRKCLEDIGSVKFMLGWDCADNIQAIEKGWKTMAFRDIHYQMHRKIGGKSSLLRGRVKHGMGAYNLGYSKGYLAIKVLHDVLKPPIVLGSVYYLKGYFGEMFRSRKPKLTKTQLQILRKLFWKSLFERGKNKNFIVFQMLSNKKG